MEKERANSKRASSKRTLGDFCEQFGFNEKLWKSSKGREKAKHKNQKLGVYRKKKSFRRKFGKLPDKGDKRNNHRRKKSYTLIKVKTRRHLSVISVKEQDIIATTAE
ncbi:hypothetical protein ACOSP7_004158 [Xanthoceras sorbifolium]